MINIQLRHHPPPLVSYTSAQVAQPVKHGPRRAGLLLFFRDGSFPVPLLRAIASKLGVISALN
ncbi:hypothetical protein D3C80_2005640 [compost metagenome]